MPEQCKLAWYFSHEFGSLATRPRCQSAGFSQRGDLSLLVEGVRARIARVRAARGYVAGVERPAM